MADFTEAIRVLRERADSKALAADLRSHMGQQDWFKARATELNRAVAVLEVAGEISADDWSTLISWIPYGTPGLVRLKALRAAVEQEE